MVARKVVAICRGTALGDPAGHQALPLLDYQAELREAGLDVAVHHAFNLDDLLKTALQFNPDIYMLMVDWHESASTVIRTINAIKERRKSRIVFLDYYAPTCTPHWPVLPYVDLYIKRQLLRDISLYQKKFRGGYIVTDFLSNQSGLDIGDWWFGSEFPWAEREKVVAGWNLGVTSKYRRLITFSKYFSIPTSRRWFDLNLRIGNSDQESWYSQYRNRAIRACQDQTRYRSTPCIRISPKRYLFELMNSKICLSPFGWGEVCFRDYEAVACRTVMVKQSMEHLVTYPDIYFENETYMAIKWDLTDLQERIAVLLSDPKKMQRLTKNAADVYASYYDSSEFVRFLKKTFDQI